MKQNFFDHLDGGWGDLISDTYRDENEINTIFKYGDEIEYNIYKQDYNALLNLPITFSSEEYDGKSSHSANIELPYELIDNKICKGKFLDTITINVTIYTESNRDITGVTLYIQYLREKYGNSCPETIYIEDDTSLHGNNHYDKVISYFDYEYITYIVNKINNEKFIDKYGKLEQFFHKIYLLKIDFK